MPRTALDRAERLFAAGRHGDLISLLEPQVPIYRESHRFYYLLGSACLRVGDVGGASAYLKRALQLDPRDRDTILALAALDLRRGETESCVAACLGLLDDRPGDVLVRKMLNAVRKEGSPEGLARLVESGRIARLYPKSRRLPPFVVPTLLALAILAAAIAARPLLDRALAEIARSRAPRPEVAALALDPDERADPVTAGGGFRYLLTREQALESFEKAKSAFQAYRDNAALIEINRLLGSNAAESVKEKASALKGFVGAPDFRTVRDAPSFSELAADPLLYEGCAVVWKGMAANVVEGGGKTEYDFLVGYEGKKRIEGIARAVAEGIPIPVDRPLEILAIVRSAPAGARLDVVAVHELGQGTGR
jgi:tetratricopeptide (TPR) repeat protein